MSQFREKRMARGDGASRRDERPRAVTSPRNSYAIDTHHHFGRGGGRAAGRASGPLRAVRAARREARGGDVTVSREKDGAW